MYTSSYNPVHTVWCRSMRIAVGSDDAYSIARFIYEYVRSKGYDVIAIGALKTGKPESWARVGFEVARCIADRIADTGILLCYTGTGVCIAANKVRGVRAALVFDATTARYARLWNDANILVLSARLVSEEVAREIVDAWLSIDKPDPSESENIMLLDRLDIDRCL
ncbi:MAG: RpiB/LacA/LacB family sugar-phosphate isomerase [Candidatus Bathyarchaeia archaeon]